MDFALTDDQEMFQGQVRKFIQTSGGTKIARDIVQNKDGFNKIHEGLAELGCTMINISEQYDGLNLNSLDLAPTFEELGKSLVPNLLLETMGLVVPLLEKYGDKAQKETYLPSIAAGERTVTFAAMEDGRDFTAEGIQCQLKKDQDHYILNGTKILVPFGQFADTFLLLVRPSSELVGDGLSLVLIDKSDDMNIVEQMSIDESRQLTKISFNNFKVNRNQIIGSIDNGWRYIQDGLLNLHAALSSYMVGALEGVTYMAVEYAKMREQFGQPIGQFQAIKHPIVDMKVHLEIARSLSYYANWVIDSNQVDKVAAVYSARSYTAEKLLSAAAHNIQIHGGIGFTEEIDCHLYLKQAQYYTQYLGSDNQFQKEISAYLIEDFDKETSGETREQLYTGS